MAITGEEIMDKKKPLVSIIIPTYKRQFSLLRTLKSIENSLYKNVEIIIVDMGDSIEQIQKLIKENLNRLHKQITLIKGHKNMYVSGAVNEAIKHAKGEFILICADDVVLEEDTIQKLVNVLLNYDDIGIICPVCYYLEAPSKIWWAGSKINMWTSRTYFYGRDIPLPDSDIFDTHSFTTIALIRRELFYNENGDLFFVDPHEFPIHNEEADFSFRARRKGWKVCVTKNAKAYHDIAVPGKQGDPARLFHVHTPERAYFAARNRIIFHKKYSNWWQFLIFILIFNWVFTLYYLRIILVKSKKPSRKKLQIAKAYLIGILDGLNEKIRVMGCSK
ncbi:MAG: glycosyltransferase family 2 protein [Candidatus Njordarchaeia archaeon]